SLAASIFWSVLFGLAFARRGRPVALWAGLAVFSHFVLDFFMHPQDLALWPHSTAHVGLGLWRLWPRGWWWFEFAFIAVFGAIYRSDEVLRLPCERRRHPARRDGHRPRRQRPSSAGRLSARLWREQEERFLLRRSPRCPRLPGAPLLRARLRRFLGPGEPRGSRRRSQGPAEHDRPGRRRRAGLGAERESRRRGGDGRLLR